MLIGRLTKDPEIRYSYGQDSMCIAKYTLAVDRKYKKAGDQSADFIPCTAFGNTGKFAEKYLTKGKKVSVIGRLYTSNYTNNEGKRINTLEVIVEDQEFVESKKSEEQNRSTVSSYRGQSNNTTPDGFMNIPEGIDEELPFS